MFFNVFHIFIIIGVDQECKFTRDCHESWICKSVADAGCACNFGKCVLTGGYFGYAPKECVSYEDCPCKYAFCNFEQLHFSLNF